ncbi:guanylate kinase [Tenacibaculum maritimum]|uniref:Guanylate kinase n=1 Tax=Tenacibaculum maritimum NCIMB 2154 TaxID=1349785 RepID=A0A2H1EE86_9FLAO|nr:guanylate kinase [Tenacibaculum maritimum]MCD9562087.1 guanylate kinase [Tenacibaculum maritimum]MCD9565606.1 guanylate kinase [Tenacibaculum maritimum]MCD9578475.1 guanylate kinase [Tenacibaculum maritimum]MCD9584664.1 guanylate kinase [Tenacibaculum maritimum]MCD9596316.1 guanylate kinase [Tenacibaculum maritimum]
MTKEFKGKLFVFSAPSGSGKTTIVRHLLAQERFNLEFSISATSRNPRSNEKEGVDYYYISLEDFKQKIKKEEFLEWEEVYRDNFYGTLKTEVERIWAKGKHVIFDIDVRGGLRIKEKFPEETLAVFVKPPDINELLKRLKKRGEESDEKIAARIAKAPIELATAPMFDKTIKNYDLAVALKDAESLVDEFLGTSPV